jgi:hypothetical protein
MSYIEGVLYLVFGVILLAGVIKMILASNPIFAGVLFFFFLVFWIYGAIVIYRTHRENLIKNRLA